MTEKDWRNQWDAVATEEKGQYLSKVSRTPAAQAYKHRTFEVLAVQPGHHLLDVGCGTGEDASRLAERVGARGRVVGVDIDPGLIRDAETHFAEANLPLVFVCQDIAALDLADNQFDGCRADRVFQHLEDVERVLRQMVRVTKVGGRVVVCEPDWETRVVYVPAERQLTRRILNYWADTRRAGWVGRELPALFAQCGLQAIQVEHISMTGIMRQYDWVHDPIALVKSAEGACEAGWVTAAEAEAWLQQLKAAEAAGHFLAHVSGFLVSGRKA